MILMFLKIYSTGNIHTSIARVDEKTLRKYSWAIIRSLIELKLVGCNSLFFIRFSPNILPQCAFVSRLRGKEVEGSFMSVDGTYFLIHEPKIFDNCWFSHEFSGPDLRYEFVVAIEPLRVVWANEP